MAKRVRLSDDNGVSYFTLPGNTATFNNESGEIEDTIFDQDFGSNEIGLIGWSVTANGLYKGFAGYVATIKKPGTSTAMTTESMSLETGKIYAIDDSTKDVFDRATTMTIFDNAVDHTADVEWIDFLFGRIKFFDTYTVTGAVTITGNYFPTVSIGTANEFTLTQTAEPIDTTDFATAQANGGHRTFILGLKTVGLELGGIHAVSNNFIVDLLARNELLVEINPDGTDKSEARGFFKYVTHEQSGDVGALEAESVTMSLTIPDETLLFLPFRWRHGATTTLNTSLQHALTAWENATVIDIEYLFDGTNGRTGKIIVTEVSLSGGLEVMNDFSCTFQGTGVHTVVP